MPKAEPYGWKVTVLCQEGRRQAEKVIILKGGREHHARTKALERKSAVRVVSVIPLTKYEFLIMKENA